MELFFYGCSIALLFIPVVVWLILRRKPTGLSTVEEGEQTFTPTAQPGLYVVTEGEPVEKEVRS